MNDLEMCRVCTSCVNSSNVTNLFERNQRSLLSQIKNITGQLLRNERNLPKYICPACEENLKTAHCFRKRCLDSQSYFHSAKYKSQHRGNSVESAPNLKKDEKDVESEDDDCVEKESFVAVKEEDDSPDVNDGIYIHEEHNLSNPSLSCLSESKQETGKVVADEFNLPIKSATEAKKKTNTSKQISRTKRTKSNKLVQKKISSVKTKKSEEKIDLICDQCGNHFNCRHHFLTHLRRHTNDKPFKCEICPDKFYTHSELKRHMRRHTGERPFSCQYCQRRFTDYSTRIKHERMHTNERPYSCKQCGKAFTTTYVLKNHMLVHTGERSFKCSLCNKAFQRQTHLTVHFRSIMHKQMLEKQENKQETSYTYETEST